MGFTLTCMRIEAGALRGSAGSFRRSGVPGRSTRDAGASTLPLIVAPAIGSLVLLASGGGRTREPVDAAGRAHLLRLGAGLEVLGIDDLLLATKDLPFRDAGVVEKPLSPSQHRSCAPEDGLTLVRIACWVVGYRGIGVSVLRGETASAGAGRSTANPAVVA